MKKLTMIAMATLLLIAASCKKDKKDEIENAGSGFRATVESHAGDSKTHLEGLAVKWDSGDAILVKSNTCTTPRGFTTQGSGATVNFDANETLPTNFYAPPYTGYYPASAFEGDQLTLPATQAYVADAATFANGANPMAATSSETLLPFKNICGVLKLQLHGTSAYGIDNITITSNTGEQLWGTGTVTLTGGIPSLGTLSGGGSSLTLSCNGAAMSTSSSSPSTYFFVVPAGTLGTSFTVKVTDSNGNVWTKTATSAANTIGRSQITAMPELAVETHTPVSPSSVTVTAGCSGYIYSVGGSVTVPSGSHNCEFGLVYSETDEMPTIEEGAGIIVVHDMSADPISGTVNFTADITDLEVGTTYHVRAYGMIDGVTYSTVMDIVGGQTPQPLPTTWTNGKSPYLFTVADPTPDNPNSGDETKVRFSQGNLQYMGTTGTWKFADHQFDFLGNNGQGSTSTTADRDLFGWGDLTGYNTSTTGADYPWTADWGTKIGTNWRTLTSGEWSHLIDTRKDSNNHLLYGEGKVGSCMPGIIILPDDWKWEGDVAGFEANWTPGRSAYINVYTYSEWAKMEASGAVFLPAAGYRYGTSVDNVGIGGNYWSSSDNGSGYAHNLNFRSNKMYPSISGSSFYGFSVRLVSDAN